MNALSQGKFQFDLWQNAEPTGMWDWDSLRAEIMEHGTRNSLLLAPMPTAGTSQILGNNECFEPYTSNLYVRRTLAGEFVCVSRHLLTGTSLQCSFFMFSICDSIFYLKNQINFWNQTSLS